MSCIQALAAWREIKAREVNKPRNWLIKDDVLCALAQQQPDSLAELAHVRSLDKKTRDRYGSEIIDTINKAKTETPEPLPAFSKKKKLNAENAAKLALLNAWGHQRAGELNIAATILTPPKLLERCVTDSIEEALQGWRAKLLQDDFARIMAGTHAVMVGTQGLALNPVQVE